MKVVSDDVGAWMTDSDNENDEIRFCAQGRLRSALPSCFILLWSLRCVQNPQVLGHGSRALAKPAQFQIGSKKHRSLAMVLILVASGQIWSQHS